MIRIFSGLDSLSRPKCIQSMGMGVFDFNVSSVCTCTVACMACSSLCRFVIMNILWQKKQADRRFGVLCTGFFLLLLHAAALILESSFLWLLRGPHRHPFHISALFCQVKISGQVTSFYSRHCPRAELGGCVVLLVI